MEDWIANERPASVFDGTLASLIDLYLSDGESPIMICVTGHNVIAIST
jgi:hypothetical protein